jgi:hypothetical protein
MDRREETKTEDKSGRQGKNRRGETRIEQDKRKTRQEKDKRRERQERQEKRKDKRKT